MPFGFRAPFGRYNGVLPAGATVEEVVADNLKRIIMTRRGERVMRPQIGSAAWDHVFENGGAISRARMRDDIRRAIALNEPRAKVLDVVVTPIADAGMSGFSVDVTYKVSRDVERVTAYLSNGVQS